MAGDSKKKVKAFKNIISRFLIDDKINDYFSRRDGMSKRNQRILFAIILWMLAIYLVNKYF
jgi:hypothetical protein